MKIYIVAPYKGMEIPIKKIIKKYVNIKIDYGIAKMNEGFKLALEAEKKGYDAIISRGGTAKLIKENIDIPTVDMKLSGNDILKSLLMAKKNNKKTALISYSNVSNGANEIIDLLDLDIDVYTITNENGVTPLLIELKEKGVEQIIGDIVAVERAEEINFSTILLQSSESTILSAVDSAIVLIKQARKKILTDNLFSKFFDITISDYILFKDKKIIQSRFDKYNKIPVSYEYLMGIKFDYDSDSTSITSEYFSKDSKIKITVTKLDDYNSNYYIYIFEDNQTDIDLIEGIYEYKYSESFKIVENSIAIKNTIKKVLDNIKEYKYLYLLGEDKYTIDNIILRYIEKFNRKFKPLVIDLDLFNFKYIYKFINDKNRLLIIRNSNNIEKLKFLDSIIKDNELDIIIVNSTIDDSINQLNSIFPIILPNLFERKEDLLDAINFSIGYYHNKFGTPSLLIEDDFYEGIDDFYDNSFENILNIIKIMVYEVDKNIISKDIFIKYYNKFKLSKKKDFDTSKTLEEVEVEYIKKILIEEDYNQSSSAERLGISRATLWRKMKNNNL